MKKLLFASVLFFAALSGVAALTSPEAPTSSTPPSPAAAAGPVDGATLQQDANMTQQMAAAGANGPMQSYGAADPQLSHSQDPAFVLRLEQYQAQIDRMLARPTS